MLSTAPCVRFPRCDNPRVHLGYFTMPVHPPERPVAETLREDRDAIVLADALGFDEAFVGEHLTDRRETITSSLLFLASLVPVTARIRLGAGTVNLGLRHPLVVAAEVAMLDHLSGGRVVLGLSAGALATDAEALGIDPEDRNRRFAEALDVLLACWREAGAPALDVRLPGNRFEVSTRKTCVPELRIGEIYPPLQRPHPELLGTIVAAEPRGAVLMGERGISPLSAPFTHPALLARHWSAYAEGCRRAGREPERDRWRIARAVFVADDARDARRYGGSDGPYGEYFRLLGAKLERVGKAGVFRADGSGGDRMPPLAEVLASHVIAGTPEEVADAIVGLARITGGFGRLLYAGLDWKEPRLARRSLELMAHEVMPLVNRALGTVSDVPRA